MKSVRLFLLVSVAFAFTYIPADIKLEYVFKVGDEFVWTQTTSQTIKQSIMGMEQNMTNKYDGQFILKVVELTTTGAKIETKFTKLKNTMTSLMGEVSMDSEGTEDKMENKVFMALMNKPFFIFMNKKGEVENIEGIENLYSGFKDIGLDENAMETMKQSLDQLFGKTALKGSFEQAFVIYPDKKIKQGDKWTVKTAAPMNFPLLIENTWNVNTLSTTTAGLQADGVYTTTDKDKTVNLPQGLKAKTDLSGKLAMKSKVDVKTGWPSSLDILSELKGTMTVLAGGMIPEDMDIPMEILSESTFTITRK